MKQIKDIVDEMEQRELKELLELLVEKLPNLLRNEGVYGLCYAPENLYRLGEITWLECMVLKNYITENLPRRVRWVDIFKWMRADNEEINDWKLRHFGWRPGRVRPRVKWLKKQIAKL